MTKFEDNLSPHLTLVEQGSPPDTPAAGTQKLFIDSADSKLKRIDESDVVTEVGGGAGGALHYEAKRTTNLALTADVTAIDFNSVALNLDSNWASGVYTAPEDGLYMFIYNLTMTAATAYILRGYVNGSAKVDGRYSTPGDQRHQAVFMEFLTAGDTFEARISASLTMDGSDTKFNWARVAKLG